ncbi:L domain-like protein [Massarina eburnea CBS 473.64]|uniref:L domain-like protein n=1 Tax=Massarina eburnea CBS 473.64 TaxID=1395130 RepID=A0A6A6SBJ8_9PLEO|nr:L domain-like protein [Massarina eburnea CBS 473.64]
MEHSGIPVRTGIPRPTSKLPVLRPSGSQSQLRSASTPAEPLRKKASLSSVSTPADPLRKKPSLSAVARPSQPPPPSLQRKTSRTSLAPLARSNTATASTTATSTTRASLYATSSARRASLVPGQARAPAPNAPGTFKKPIGRTSSQPPSRQTRLAPQPTRASTLSHEDDVLGDLDGFRSVSGASSGASSRTGVWDPEQDYAYVIEDDEEATNELGKAHPSLVERTVSSLSQVPPSPGRRGRRRSSFFGVDDSTLMPPPLRPGSSDSRRPITSDGTSRTPIATPRKTGPPAPRIAMTGPGKRSTSGTATTPAVSRLNSTAKKQTLTPTHNMQATSKPRPLSSGRSTAARTPQPRPSLGGSFGQAISPPGASSVTTTPSPSRGESVAKATPVTSRKVSSSSSALRDQLTKVKTARKTEEASEQPPKGKPTLTLREQIAKAKEAARASTARESRTSTPPREAIVPTPVEIAGFDFGLDDPFNQGPKGGKSLLRKRIDGGRVDGRLNLAAMGLKEVPTEVLNMYKYDSSDTTVAWGEVVDLTIIVAADNEFETLPDTMFPDIDMDTIIDDDDDDGPQFGAIQNFDLHGNVLRELPVGLRQLTQLTKLNLSRNKLSPDALEIVCQITTLRDLKLAENALEGSFPPSLENLSQLEILELQGNKLTSLPPEIRELSHLRILNVSDNCLRGLPADLFTSAPITELLATKNNFIGAFFNIDTAPHLQNLQLANNSLTSLCESDTILLPALKYLDLSGNRLSALPDMSSWTSLATLLMGNNKLNMLPEGFLSLKALRAADFTANDLNKLDEKIALMEGLDNLTLAANPLRERKFLSMTTADIKRDLLSRVQPELLGDQDDCEEIGGNDQAKTLPDGWKLTPSGTLDLSFQNLTELDDESVATLAETNDIRQLYLASNYLTEIPTITLQLSFLSVLDLSKNNVTTALAEPVELAKLRELRLRGNKMQSLDSITSLLSAPKLIQLDVSNNRISGTLPTMRDFFPELTSFLASDNAISEVPAESLAGLKTVNLSNNDITRLEPDIGRYRGTLTSFEVDGNRFRVPNYSVLKRGTEATLNWLRDKIPNADTPASPKF